MLDATARRPASAAHDSCLLPSNTSVVTSTALVVTSPALVVTSTALVVTSTGSNPGGTMRALYVRPHKHIARATCGGSTVRGAQKRSKLQQYSCKVTRYRAR
eukprot:scaffold16108_cov61-Phaeocystis_antarctica.AAC.4